MRTTMLAAAAVLFLLLAGAGTAGAVDLPSHRTPDAERPAPAGTAPDVRFVTLGASLAGTATVTGRVYDFGGAPLAGATVSWTVPVGDIDESGDVQTGPDGLYTFASIPGAMGNGELFVSPATEPWSIGRTGVSWPEPGSTTFDFRPGVISTSLQRGGPWADWSDAWVYVFGADATSRVEGTSNIAGTSAVVTGDAWAMAGVYDGGAVNFFMDEGLEFATTAAVTGGGRSGQSISVDESLAQRIMVTAPYWGSGKPGTTVKVGFEGFPGGWTLEHLGFSDSPGTAAFRTFGTSDTSGTGSFTKSFTVPSRAPAGYSYLLEASHTGGYLVLDTPFQVCTLKSSKNSVRRGGTIRLSGVVPVEGHWGREAGTPKWVTIYRRARYASPPTVWDATKRGWIRVGRVKANGLGRYARYLRPTRTTWYVVRYPGDDWYWRAYTSVLKVRVY
jgi:hypothetical protein